MSGWSGLLALWLVFSGATVAGFLWAASRETVADLDEPHRCLICADLDDMLARLDLSLWVIECEADA